MERIYQVIDKRDNSVVYESEWYKNVELWLALAVSSQFTWAQVDKAARGPEAL